MKRKELAPGIVVYEDVMQDHDTFIKDIEDVVESGHAVWQDSYVNVGSESKKDSSIRDTQSLSIAYEQKNDQGLVAYFQESVRELFFNSFNHLEKEYMSSFGINCSDHDQYQILKYGVGQKFVNHIDDGPIHHRRVSTVYYVNDDYEGGEILFPRFGLSYKPKANELLIFPSTYVYNHSVRPVLSGTRYAVVSWIK